jgi:hypothetical protein
LTSIQVTNPAAGACPPYARGWAALTRARRSARRALASSRCASAEAASTSPTSASVAASLSAR